MLADAVRRALAKLRDKQMEVPSILEDVEQLADKCFARFSAEENAMDVFSDLS